MLTLDVAIATRNRAQVLDLSLPLLLKQSRKPKSILIVDSSDDPRAVPNVVRKHAATTEIPIKFFRSSAGTAIQRNVALEHVTSDVVMFPDDDSLLLPGALDAIMRVYEADVEERIGGVCGREVVEAPADVLSVARERYEMTRADRMKQLLARQRLRLERQLFADPIKTHGRSRWNVHAVPEWLCEKNAVLVEYMTGFRMSFRSSIIKKCGFDDSLGRYALFEDIDASFSVMKTHLVVAAENCEIFHYKSPERRDRGTLLGILHILNRAYVVCRHAEPNSPARNHIRPFSRLKLALYAMEAKTEFGRERFKGALRAYGCLPILLQAAPEDLTETYLRLRDHCLNTNEAFVRLPARPRMPVVVDLHADVHSGIQRSERALSSSTPGMESIPGERLTPRIPQTGR